MKSLIAAVLIVATVAQAATIDVYSRASRELLPVAPVAILRQSQVANDDGSYQYGFESADGIKAEVSGAQKLVGPKAEDIGTVSKGSYSYTSPEGQVITVHWSADENGFRATGDHLPTPPPTPAHVVKLLADLKAAGVL